MKIALTAINAKYAHTNPAIRLLKKTAPAGMADILMNEYTINMQLSDILAELYAPDICVYGFSVYIWNVELVLKAARAVKQLNPNALVLLGGPEVSFETEELMQKHPFIDYVIAGEGEVPFAAFVRYMQNETNAGAVPALYYRSEGEILHNPPGDPVQMDKLPFLYDDLSALSRRVLYYESSRGCPYNCHFCLSSATKGVRYRPVELVRADIDRFVQANVMKVKFVDRTFNADRQRAREIFSYVIEKGGNTGFHFEISASLLDDETIEILKNSPPGRIQVEAGIQSVKEDTLYAVNRTEKFATIREKMLKLSACQTIHTHVDLIAGLPKENYADFGKSFDGAFFLKADNLQLGFLKVLKGCELKKQATKYGLQYLPYAPYTVLATADISFEELNLLRRVEDSLERYYNSGLLKHTAFALAKQRGSAFALFEELDGFIREQKPQGEIRQDELIRYLYLYAREWMDKALLKDMLLFDISKKRTKLPVPHFLRDPKREAFEKDFFHGGYRAYPELGRLDIKSRRVLQIAFDPYRFMENGAIIKQNTICLFEYSENQENTSFKIIRS